MSDTTNNSNPTQPPRKLRRTRGKGRKITYWDDKAINPPKPCTICGGETVHQFRRDRCIECGAEF